MRVENRYWGSKRPEGKRPHGNLGEGHSTREQQVQPGVLWMGRRWCRGAQGSSRGRLRGSTGHRKDPRLYSEWACPQDSWGPWQECQRRSRYYVSEHLEAINQATIKKNVLVSYFEEHTLKIVKPRHRSRIPGFQNP